MGSVGFFAFSWNIIIWNYICAKKEVDVPGEGMSIILHKKVENSFKKVLCE